ncbi:6375_t:CDS:2, partial [Racocetra fulgida]
AIFQTYCFPEGHPEGRGGHESVLVNDKLYFMGGSRLVPKLNPKRYNLSDEVFYLDLSLQFTTRNPPFIDLTDGTSRMFFGNEKGSDKSDVYLIGGTQLNLATLNWSVTNQVINWNVTEEFIFIYRTVPKIWTKLFQGVKGTQPPRRRSTSTVIKPNDNTPSPRSHSTATLLPNGKIVYIGGVSQDTPGSQTNLIIMTEVNLHHYCYYV